MTQNAENAGLTHRNTKEHSKTIEEGGVHDITYMKQTLNLETRRMLRLSEVHRLIKEHEIIIPPLARRTLTKMCEEGVFETVGNKPMSFGWLIYEDSFWKWVRGLDEIG